MACLRVEQIERFFPEVQDIDKTIPVGEFLCHRFMTKGRHRVLTQTSRHREKLEFIIQHQGTLAKRLKPGKIGNSSME
jgi:hypothetical protein